MNKDNVFLGVVNREGNIDIPWRDTTIFVGHVYEYGQILLVTLNNNYSAIKVELPTLEQVKQMKDELLSDWDRFAQIFLKLPMGRKVEMLRALDRKVEVWNKE